MTDPQLTLREQLTAAIQRAEAAEQDRDAALALLPLEFREETTGLCESVKRLADCWNNQALAIKELLDKKMAAESALAAAREVLKTIVCTEPPDDGVVLLSDYGPTHHEERTPGHVVTVYDHEHFSPLGDALIKLHNVLSGNSQEVSDE